MSLINVGNYPSSNLVPGVFGVVNNSGANTAIAPQRTMLIGGKTASGTYVPSMPIIATSQGDCEVGAGQGSMMASMLRRYRKNDSFGEVWLLPIADNGQAAAASGQIAITGTATAAGVFTPYIAGLRVPVGVNVGDSAATVAANMVSQCALHAGLQASATAAAGAGTVTLTALHKSLAGNDIDIRLNYRGQAGGEVTPAGLTVAITPMAGGALNPDITAGLGAIAGNQTFDFIVLGFNDPTSLAAVSSFLNDQSGRWSWSQQLYGGAWSAVRGNLSALATFGATMNDQHTQIMGFFDVPNPYWEVAADLTATAASSLRSNPAVPLNTLAMTILPPPLQSRFTMSEQNSLLTDGLSTYDVDDSGTLRIERCVTTYQRNAAGAPDNSYRNTEGLYTLQFCLRDLIGYLKSLYSRSILVADGTSIPFGSSMTTSQIVLKSAIARYQLYCNLGLMQNFAIFAKTATAVNAGGGVVQLALPMQRSDQLEQIVAAVNLVAA
jgi:phage tail sheath gpL-like